MYRQEQGSHLDEYTIRLGIFSVYVKNVSTFALYIHEPNTRVIKDGNIRVDLNKIGITYGAGPCIGGLAIFRKNPYIFYYDPNKFQDYLELLDNAEAGIIGGDVRSYLSEQHRINLSQFSVIEGAVASFLVNHKEKRKLDLLYMIH